MKSEIPSFEDVMNSCRGMGQPLREQPDYREQPNYIAMVVPIAFDHETAIALADRFVDEKYFVLLESATSGPNARYSYLGFDPIWVWQYDVLQKTVTMLQRDSATPTVQHIATETPIADLKSRMASKTIKASYAAGVHIGGPDIARMIGTIGYFGYNMAQVLEPTIGPVPRKELGVPDACFFLPRSFLVIDHLSRRLFVTRLLPVASSQEALLGAYQIESQNLKSMLKKLRAPHGPPALELINDPIDYQQFSSHLTEDEFCQKVAVCLEYVRAGDVFQIQIGNRLKKPTTARPFDIFRHLRMLNPSPYMFFYRVNDHHILGASPEMMMQVQMLETLPGNALDATIIHRPIAGTRRRTWDAHKDAAMKAELAESEKERAEHVMLVDLSRNDIGRIAKAGSVKVEELMVIEEYSHVFHLVSQVSGKLGDDIDSYDALIASFPNGTVTGAPKIKAMELINKLETISREFYAGCLGIISFEGDLRTTLLIRTIHVAGGVASTQASAGIVYDSVPAHEWQETRNKMAACLLAIQNTN